MTGTSHRLLPWQRIEWLNDVDRTSRCIFQVQTGITAAAADDDEDPPGKLKLGLINVDKKKTQQTHEYFNDLRTRSPSGGASVFSLPCSLCTVVSPSPLHRQGCRFVCSNMETECLSAHAKCLKVISLT